MSSKVIHDTARVVLKPMLWRQLGPEARAGMESQRKETIALAVRSSNAETGDQANEEEAYRRGYADGEAARAGKNSAEMEAMVERLTRTMAALAGVRSRLRREAEEDLLKLSIAIAKRVLHRELTVDPESVQGLLKVALEKLQSREISRVRIHPRLEGPVRACLARLGATRGIDVSSDVTLEWGDVIFETAHGNLDASIDSQLREIERGFADRLKSHS